MGDWRKRNARALLQEFQEHGLAMHIRLNDYVGEDLRGEVFSPGEDLAGTDFRDADLTDARLPGARLAGVDLSRANLTGARLDGADLTRANLTQARLDGASLIGVNLTGAQLDGTSWRRTRLIGAQVPAGAIVKGWGTAAPDHSPRLQIRPAARSSVGIAWHPDGDLLATASGPNVILWDLQAGVALATLEGHQGGVWSVAFSADGSRLASGGGDGVVRLWDPETGAGLAVLEGHQDTVLSVAFSADGLRLASGGGDRTVRVWDPETGAIVAVLKGHQGTVWSVAFSPDGSRLASGADTLRVADITRLPRRAGFIDRIRNRFSTRVLPVGESLGDPADGIASLAYSPEGTTIATAHPRGYITLKPAQPDSSQSLVRLIGLPEGGWAVLHGEHQYELHGDPAGAFWWSAGLCRFEPGELDGFGVERLNP
jgi:Pentapeptide repeats (8 copies)/WD domain, G-beta repeat